MSDSLPAWDPNLRKKTKGFVHKQEKYDENVETLKCVMPHLFRESYEYNNAADMLEGHAMLIDVLEYVLYQLHGNPIVLIHRSMFMKIIPWILKRKELNVGHIRKIGEKKDPEQKDIIKIWKRFAAWLMKALLFAVKELNAPDPQHDLVEVCLKIVAFSYFVFPPDIIASRVYTQFKLTLTKEERTDMKKYMGPLTATEKVFSIKEIDRGVTIDSLSSKSFFEHINLLYNFLIGTQELKKFQTSMASFPTLPRVCNNEEDLLSFFGIWIRQLVDILKMRSSPTTIGVHIPGFFKMLMPITVNYISKVSNVDKIQKSVMVLVKMIIAIDPNLFDVYFKIITPKINIYSQVDIKSYFLWLDHWLNVIQSTTCALPSHLLFDYNFFFQIVTTLLCDDHHATVTRILILTHNYLHLFPIEEKNKFVTTVIFGDKFYYLFLHWCFGARSVFHRICAYQILNPEKLLQESYQDMAKEIVRDPEAEKPIVSHWVPTAFETQSTEVVEVKEKDKEDALTVGTKTRGVKKKDGAKDDSSVEKSGETGGTSANGAGSGSSNSMGGGAKGSKEEGAKKKKILGTIPTRKKKSLSISTPPSTSSKKDKERKTETKPEPDHGATMARLQFADPPKQQPATTANVQSTATQATTTASSTTATTDPNSTATTPNTTGKPRVLQYRQRSVSLQDRRAKLKKGDTVDGTAPDIGDAATGGEQNEATTDATTTAASTTAEGTAEGAGEKDGSKANESSNPAESDATAAKTSETDQMEATPIANQPTTTTDGSAASSTTSNPGEAATPTDENPDSVSVIGSATVSDATTPGDSSDSKTNEQPPIATEVAEVTLPPTQSTTAATTTTTTITTTEVKDIAPITTFPIDSVKIEPIVIAQEPEDVLFKPIPKGKASPVDGSTLSPRAPVLPMLPVVPVNTTSAPSTTTATATQTQPVTIPSTATNATDATSLPATATISITPPSSSSNLLGNDPPIVSHSGAKREKRASDRGSSRHTESIGGPNDRSTSPRGARRKSGQSNRHTIHFDLPNANGEKPSPSADAQAGATGSPTSASATRKSLKGRRLSAGARVPHSRRSSGNSNGGSGELRDAIVRDKPASTSASTIMTSTTANATGATAHSASMILSDPPPTGGASNTASPRRRKQMKDRSRSVGAGVVRPPTVPTIDFDAYKRLNMVTLLGSSPEKNKADAEKRKGGASGSSGGDSTEKERPTDDEHALSPPSTTSSTSTASATSTSPNAAHASDGAPSRPTQATPQSPKFAGQSGGHLYTTGGGGPLGHDHADEKANGENEKSAVDPALANVLATVSRSDSGGANVKSASNSPSLDNAQKRRSITTKKKELLSSKLKDFKSNLEKTDERDKEKDNGTGKSGDAKDQSEGSTTAASSTSLNINASKKKDDKKSHSTTPRKVDKIEKKEKKDKEKDMKDKANNEKGSSFNVVTKTDKDSDQLECAKCFFELKDGEKFCPQCGTSNDKLTKAKELEWWRKPKNSQNKFLSEKYQAQHHTLFKEKMIVLHSIAKAAEARDGTAHSLANEHNVPTHCIPHIQDALNFFSSDIKEFQLWFEANKPQPFPILEFKAYDSC